MTIDMRWNGRKCKLCKDVPIQVLIGDDRLYLSPFTIFFLHTWFDDLKQLNLGKQLIRLRWLACYIKCKPNCVDFKFEYWMNRGITVYCNIVENRWLSFQTQRKILLYFFFQIFTVPPIFLKSNLEKIRQK